MQLRSAELMLQDRGEVVQLPSLSKLLQPDRYSTDWEGSNSFTDPVVGRVLEEYRGVLEAFEPQEEQVRTSPESGFLFVGTCLDADGL